MALPFLDTNILLRHLRADVPHQSPRATALIERIERGELEIHLSDLVIFETVFTLQRSYKVSKDRIRDALLPIIELPGIGVPVVMEPRTGSRTIPTYLRPAEAAFTLSRAASSPTEMVTATQRRVQGE